MTVARLAQERHSVAILKIVNHISPARVIAMRLVGLIALVSAIFSSIAFAQTVGESGAAAKAEAAQLNRTAGRLSSQGRFSEALVASEKALEIGEAAFGSEDKNTGVLLKNLGIRHHAMGQYAKAEPLFIRAVTIAEKSGLRVHPDTELIGDYLAAGYIARRQFAKAERLLLSALAVAEKQGVEQPSTGVRLNLLAGLYTTTSQYAKAEPLYLRALAIAEKSERPEHPNTGTILDGLAMTYQGMGQYAKAEPLFLRALATAEKFVGPDDPSTIATLSNLAQLYRKMAQYAKAEPLYLRALAITEKAEGPASQSTSTKLHSLAVLYETMGQYVKAEPIYLRALAITEKADGPEHSNTGTILTDLAVLYNIMGQPTVAEPLYLRALSIAAKNPDVPMDRFRAQRNYAQFLLFRNRPDPAIFFGKLAVNTFQGVREAAKGLDTAAQKSLIDNNQTIYQNLANWLITGGRLAEAEQVLAMLKQQELQELTRRSDAQVQQVVLTGAEVGLARRFEAISLDGISANKALQALTLREQQGATLSPAELTERDRLRATLRVHNDAFQAFLSTLQASLSQDPQSAQRERDQLNRDAQGLQTLLRQAGPGHVGLQYVVTDKQLSVIVSLSNTSFARQIPVSRETLNRQIAALRAVVQTPKKDPLPAAQALYASLMAPIQAELDAANAHTIVLSLTDLLRYAPFAALHDGKQYMAERFALALYTPAGGKGVTKPNIERWQIAGLGLTQAVTVATDNNRVFAALPGVKQELSGIVRGLQSPNGLMAGEVSLDAQFTRARFEQALPRFAVMHVASHFQFAPGSEHQSYLVMGDGTRLSLADLKDLPFEKVELLTLSACDTANGGGRNERGSEVEGLAAALQLAGARAVLATLWPVDDASTGALMRRFYQLRQQQATLSTLTTAQALRQAQLDLLQGRITPDALSLGSASVSNAPTPSPTANPADRPQFRHPYYWAPFILMGNWL